MANEGENVNYWKGDEPDDQSPAPTEAKVDPRALSEGAVNWQAQEYIPREKHFGWYAVFVLVCLGLIAIDFFLIRSWTFSALVVVMAIALVVYSNRPPRMVNYSLSVEKGLYVGEKLYNLNEFKAFGLVREDQNLSIFLIPTKRFALGVSVYFPEEAGEQIFDILGAHLPMEKLELDPIDKLVRRLRI